MVRWVTWKEGNHDKRCRSTAVAAYGSVMQRGRETYDFYQRRRVLPSLDKNLPRSIQSCSTYSSINVVILWFQSIHQPVMSKAICSFSLILSLSLSCPASFPSVTLFQSSWKEQRTAGSHLARGVCHTSSPCSSSVPCVLLSCSCRSCQVRQKCYKSNL